jgi:hypothetical protein
MRLIKRYSPFWFWALVGVIIFIHFHIGHKSEATRPELRVGCRGALIKWGIASAEQFERARINDPEIAEACPVGFLHPVILTQDVWKSVAYRFAPYEEQQNGAFTRGSRIFWTPVIKIPTGELVFEDKQGNIVRGRCGNCTQNDLLRFSLPVVIWKVPVFRLHTTAL